MEKLNRRRTCEVIIYQQNIKNLSIYQDTQDGYQKKVEEKHGVKQLVDTLTSLQNIYKNKMSSNLMMYHERG